MATKTLPYETASSGERALVELQAVLAKFGCAQFGTATDAEKGETIVHFKWREQRVALHASWKGYAQAWLKAHPFNSWTRGSKQEYERKALQIGQRAVCSVLRDWVKGQITAVECGVLSFEAAFMPHMLLKDGRRVVEAAQDANLLPAPDEKIVRLGND